MRKLKKEMKYELDPEKWAKFSQRMEWTGGTRGREASEEKCGDVGKVQHA